MAEPRFDGVPPMGGALKLSWIRHFSDCFAVVAEEQSQNLLASAEGGAPAPGFVVKKLAGLCLFKLYRVLPMPKRCPLNAPPPHSKSFASSGPFAKPPGFRAILVLDFLRQESCSLMNGRINNKPNVRAAYALATRAFSPA